MLKTRIATAAVLLAILLLVVWSGSYIAFSLVTTLFFAAAVWESQRLFKAHYALAATAGWTAVFLFALYLLSTDRLQNALGLFALCAAIWAIRLVPSLRIGLPPIQSNANRLLGGVYGICILGCFLAIAVLFNVSALYLFSVLIIVWIADIGAYAAGKAFGKRKIAPSISPGKSWEGAIGGWVAVLAAAAGSLMHPAMSEMFTARLHAAWGWAGLLIVTSVMVAASVVGDLFESQLKRRAGMKDSGNSLPGHGGVLDRIDAVIPALPLAVLFHSFF